MICRPVRHIPHTISERRPADHKSLVRYVLCAAAVIISPVSGNANNPDDKPASESLNTFWQEIPSAAFKFEMVYIPGDSEKNIKPFWIGRTEMPWEPFDVFVYGLDVKEDSPSGETAPDAVTRPTKPYLPPDRGFGHEGYAVISVSHHMATEFCKWLSIKSGKTYRLPTEAEWEHACRAGASATAYCFGDDVPQLGQYAWYADNAGGMPRPIGLKKANDFGLHDMHGNVAEWCDSSSGGEPVTCGGSYRDAADKVTTTSRAPFDPSWNVSDPQIPKSEWWLADGPFVGFRVVCDYDPTIPEEKPQDQTPATTVKGPTHARPVSQD